jgi:hypothetical protein
VSNVNRSTTAFRLSTNKTNLELNSIGEPPPDFFFNLWNSFKKCCCCKNQPEPSKYFNQVDLSRSGAQNVPNKHSCVDVVDCSSNTTALDIFGGYESKYFGDLNIGGLFDLVRYLNNTCFLEKYETLVFLDVYALGASTSVTFFVYGFGALIDGTCALRKLASFGFDFSWPIFRDFSVNLCFGLENALIFEMFVSPYTRVIMLDFFSYLSILEPLTNFPDYYYFKLSHRSYEASSLYCDIIQTNSSVYPHFSNVVKSLAYDFKFDNTGVDTIIDELARLNLDILNQFWDGRGIVTNYHPYHLSSDLFMQDKSRTYFYLIKSQKASVPLPELFDL